MTESNPYLEKGRLADVIAAITAMANYRFYKLTFEKAAERITNRPEHAEKWKTIFYEHPEFFRVSHDKVSLVWRRQNPKSYNTKTSKDISRDTFDQLVRIGTTDHISRRPLKPEETTALIDVAVKLHERAIEDKKMKHWWIPILAAVLSFIGAILGVILTTVLSA